QKAIVTLSREDGRKYSYSLGNINPGFVKEIALDGRAGEHHYEGSMEAQVEGELVKSPLSFDTVVAPPLTISVDRGSVDLERRRFLFKTSRAVHTWSLTVIGVDGSELASEDSSIK